MVSVQMRVLEAYLRVKRLVSEQGRLDVERERAEVESLARMFKPLVPIRTTAVQLDRVHGEWIDAGNAMPKRAILYLHGGSFCAGSVVSHRTLAGNVAWACRARALLIDYRLAPEYPFPAGLDDCITAYESILSAGQDPQQLIVAGDSAGGNLTLALMLHLRDRGRPLPRAAVCLSPAPDLTFSSPSWTSNASRDLMLDVAKERQAIKLYLGDRDPTTPLASPYFGDLAGLPPMLLQVGSNEVLVSDVERFAEKAKAAGVDVTLEVWPGMQHEWQFTASLLPEGKHAVIKIGEFVQSILGRPDQ